MANDEFRIFLSAVSSEFASGRNALADALQSLEGVFVRVQRSFRHDGNAGTLLQKLANYIESCDAVVCLLGSRSGAGFPKPAEAAPYAHLLPDGITDASYTQWELLLARHFGRSCPIYVATAAFTPDPGNIPAGDRPELQTAFVAHVRSLGVQWQPVNNAHEFRAEVLKDLWPSGRASKPILLPYPSLGSLFKGRDPFLRRLRASLTRADGGAAAIAGRAVHGLGGVGKTRAAVEYAWAHRGDYNALLWLEAETPARLQSSFAALVGPLRLAENAAAEEAVRVEAVLAWLNAHPGCLLILDNIDTAAALDAANWLLGRLSGGHVVLTSRLGNFPRGVERLDLGVLDPADAAGFLLDATASGRRKAVDDPEQAHGLAEELGQLALALEMAAGTIERRGLGFAAYRRMWQDNRARVFGWASAAITGYHHAVAETWQTSVDQLTDAGRTLLERLAFLAPDPVPEFLLEVPVPGAAAEDAMDALADLAGYSLVTRDLAGETFVVHRLVQDVTRRGLAVAGTERQVLTEALGWVNTAFVGDAVDVRSWPRLDPLAPHAEAVVMHADQAAIAAPTAQLMGQLDSLFDAKALYRRAEPYSRRALDIDEASLGKDHPQVAIRLNDLAQLLHATNRLEEAEPLMRRALAIDEASLGKDHPTVAIRLSNLAALLQDTNRLGEAESLMRRALAIDEANYGKDHPNVANRLNNLAQLLRATNRIGEAELLLRSALAIDEASLGKDHPNVATALTNLATLVQATNRLGEAESLMRRALAIDEANYGKDHPNVATDLNNLALLLQATTRIGEAEPLMRRVIDIFEASLGNGHPNVAAALNNLAELLRATSRLGEAEPLIRRALAIDEASYGKGHPEVATDLNNLATLLQAINRLGEAEPLIRRTVAIFLAFQRDTGHAHPHRDAAIRNYANLLGAMGRSEAEIRAAIAALLQQAGLSPT